MSKKKNSQNVVILGAGISGLTVSYFLNKFKVKNIIIEKQDKSGGLLRSFKIKNFVFDNFIHISHAKKKIVKNFFNKSAKNFLINPRPNNLYKKKMDSPFTSVSSFPFKILRKN